MENSASIRLKRLNRKIMHTWEERALEEVGASIHQESLALRDSLPEFLTQIASALSTTVNRTRARVKWDQDESTRVGKKHGRERATSYDYTMDQLILEYHILRQVICELLEEEAPLTADEREIIICAVEQAVNDAATEFSDTLRVIQETFTHTLAHDLRTPITSAKLSAEIMLRDPDLTDKSMPARISSSMDRLNNMVEDLLDVSLLKAGAKMKLHKAKCDINEIINDVADEANFVYKNRIEVINCTNANGIWCAKSIRRVIDNLVTNAIKYSTPGTPIKIQVSNRDKGFVVSVHNEGNPIDPQDLAILFQQYRRVQSAGQKRGWGLGLSVVKGITDAHGGEVNVESSPESGTTFRVYLPRLESST